MFRLLLICMLSWLTMIKGQLTNCNHIDKYYGDTKDKSWYLYCSNVYKYKRNMVKNIKKMIL